MASGGLKSAALSKLQIEKHAKGFLEFVNGSPSPFHAVLNCKEKLTKNGFKELKEKESWAGKLDQGGKYFFTRNQSSIVAFAVGGEFKPGNGFSIIGAHTDSPCLKVKPISKKESSGFLQVGVQTYGGGLAGRVIVATTESKLESHLVRINSPILRISNLAIHLNREVNKSFTFNAESQLLPIFATVAKTLNLESSEKVKLGESSISASHHPQLLGLICKELDIDAEQIVDLELCLYDTQASCFGGFENEFIYSARLDNLMMSYACLESLIGSLEKHDLSMEPNVRMICLYDNEEVGSASAYGADSHLTEAALRRIQSSLCNAENPTAFEESIHKSYMISADMAHAVHPNYADKHEANHRPKFHDGLVIKVNASQKYATTAATSAVLKTIASRHGLPLQEFVVRNDCACGSTIGPILSAKLGLQTIDVGCPQLSMHSIREVAGTTDIAHAIKIFEEFYGELPNILENMQID
ncbi:hypothetical protein DSO57_1033664 [Entomophthora muscae]|uniref:Uncharacterized protein n=1 Tax=Entomophthora muscae TaxID=34485 RepID=A0ACC2SD09_9FUNG|nr:hypothetical protein DSO57_1033664 [Entomophthora muscae]